MEQALTASLEIIHKNNEPNAFPRNVIWFQPFSHNGQTDPLALFYIRKKMPMFGDMVGDIHVW